MQLRRRTIPHVGAVLSVLSLPLFQVRAEQATNSPERLVRFITYQSGRKQLFPDEFVDYGLMYGEYWANFRAAKSLSDRGASALPAIEHAMASLKANGFHSRFAKNSGWLLLAYARIRGRDAYPRLMAMTHLAGLHFLRPSIDRAIAL